MPDRSPLSRVSGDTQQPDASNIRQDVGQPATSRLGVPPARGKLEQFPAILPGTVPIRHWPRQWSTTQSPPSVPTCLLDGHGSLTCLTLPHVVINCTPCHFASS